MALGHLAYLKLIYALMLNLPFQQPKTNTEKDKPLLPSSGFTEALRTSTQYRRYLSMMSVLLLFLQR